MSNSADEATSLSDSNSTTEIASNCSEEDFRDPFSFSTNMTATGSETGPLEFADHDQFNPKYAAKIAELAASFLREVSQEENWAQPRLVNEPGRLQVATSTLPYAPFCFRVEAELQGDAEAAFALMHDLAKRPDWDDMCEEAQVIEQLDPLTFIYRVKLKGRWPTSSRDSCNLIGFRKLKDGRFLSVAQSIKDERCPADPSGRPVRMHTRLSGNLFVPLSGSGGSDERKFHLIQLIDADPKGMIPSALVQRVSSKSFPLTMRKIEAAIAGRSAAGYYEGLLAQAAAAAAGNNDEEELSLNDRLERFEAQIKQILPSPPSKRGCDACLTKWLPVVFGAVNTALLLVILKQVKDATRRR